MVFCRSSTHLQSFLLSSIAGICHIHPNWRCDAAWLSAELQVLSSAARRLNPAFDYLPAVSYLREVSAKQLQVRGTSKLRTSDPSAAITLTMFRNIFRKRTKRGPMRRLHPSRWLRQPSIPDFKTPTGVSSD